MTMILGTDSASTRVALAGKRVIHVAASGGTVIAAVRREGVYRVDGEVADPLWEGDARSCAVAPDGTLYVGSEPAMVFRSTDDGDSWTRLDAIDALPTRDTWTFPPPPHEPHLLSIDFPAGRSEDVLAGVEVGGVIRSEDGGDAWTELNSGVYEDVHSVRPDPSRPSWLFAITGAGFYASEEGGGSWERRMEGMERGYTIGLSVSPDRAGELLVTAGRRPPGVEAGVYASSDRGQLGCRRRRRTAGLVRSSPGSPANDGRRLARRRRRRAVPRRFGRGALGAGGALARIDQRHDGRRQPLLRHALAVMH